MLTATLTGLPTLGPHRATRAAESLISSTGRETSRVRIEETPFLAGLLFVVTSVVSLSC